MELTDLQKVDLIDLVKAALPMYNFIHKFEISPELAEARKKVEEAEFWIQQHIVRNGSGRSE